MESIQIYESPEFGKIRTVLIDGEPYFVGKDVADILGYSDSSSAVSKNVDNEDKTTLLLEQDGSNYKSRTTLINESGLYSLILGSKLPTAKKFKRWVTSEVLPSIRKTGSYSMPQMSAMEMIAGLANNAVKVEKTLSEHDKRLDELEEKADFNIEGVVREALNYATLNFEQQNYIQVKVGLRVMHYCIDSGISYHDRKKHYRRLYADLYRVFGVNSYKNIRVKDFDRAVKFIDGWEGR